MTRYEAFKAAGSPGGIYSIWLRGQIREWAEESGRAVEMEDERRDGWQFPALLSAEHHAAFDAWLNARVVPAGSRPTREQAEHWKRDPQILG